ncbi:AdoMet dependent proline di-methyltransferase-domain-containing protein [Elsinoe ampelina]|uniref:Alpha N-terminal protein methyltransferase 1 n=1 Tax=Elsinoe ampelina TaxID=302913 RepID=A0A6A6GFP6_9PEZI|nr:AdoMet dependent proline di-methyltransferase-domain-containing protein [Elsinoe ampelina]
MPTRRSSSSPQQKRARLSSASKPTPPIAPPTPNDPSTPPADSPTDLDDPDLQAPDSHINHSDAIAYWSSTPATVSGVLGGYPALSRTDIQGSANFLAKLRRQGAGKEQKEGDAYPKPSERLRRVVDCGAGIGRISVGLLGKVAKRVDVVEPVGSFCEVGKNGIGQNEHGQDKEEEGVEQANGEEENTAQSIPDTQLYDLIWNQWCVGQLTDKQLTEYLAKSIAWLSPGGFIVVKENLSNHVLGQDIFDETDSSVTRTEEKFEKIFEDAGLKIVKTELQRGFPRELYPVRIWGLVPSAAGNI